MPIGSEEMIRIMKEVILEQDPPDDERDEAREFREGIAAEMKAVEEYAEENGLPLQWEIPAEIPEPF